MNFESYLKKAWMEHGEHTERVANDLPDGIKLIESAQQVPQMAQLIGHVAGEHLGRWGQGLYMLQLLTELPCFSAPSEAASAVARVKASIEIASGVRSTVAEFSLSDQIRIGAGAAAMLAEHGSFMEAGENFRSALQAAAAGGVGKGDPAAQTLAMTANNLACTLEEKPSRSAKEAELMILAAEAARTYWAIVGTWLEVSRAEYRLAMTFLKALNPNQALLHAEKCVTMAQEHQAEPTELFFAHEALALAEKARGNQAAYQRAVEMARGYYDQLSEDGQNSFRATLKTLD